jgi:hypothetical protein
LESFTIGAVSTPPKLRVNESNVGPPLNGVETMPVAPTPLTTANVLTSVEASVPPKVTSKPAVVGAPAPPMAVTASVAPAGQPAMPSIAAWMPAAL